MAVGRAGSLLIIRDSLSGLGDGAGLRAQLNHEGLDGQQRGGVGSQSRPALLDGGDPGQGLLRAGGGRDPVEDLGEVDINTLDVAAHLGDQHVAVEGQQVDRPCRLKSSVAEW